MLSPAGAEGHHQILPSTRKVLEQRAGRALNPHDLHESIYMAAEVMRENLAKFKDPVAATKAYNSGWRPERWDNPETNGYIAALWGDRLPSLKDTRPAKPDGTPVADAQAAAAVASLPFAQPGAGVDVARDRAREQQTAAEAEQARKDGTGVGTVASEALRDPRVMPSWTVLQRFADGPAVADPAWDYMQNRDRIEKDLSDDEREYLRENAVSEESAQRSLAELAYRRDIDRTYADAGGFKSFVGQMAAGVTDPGSLLLGLGAVKAFQLARIGSGAYIAAGRGGAAAVSMAAENAAANVAIEGLSDIMGEHKTSADYAMAAAAGAALTLPFARGVFRQAAEAEAHRLAQDTISRAAQEQAGAVAKVRQDNPDLPPDAVARKVVEDETEAIRTTVAETVGPQRLDRVVPEDVGREMRDEFAGKPPEETAPNPDTPKPVTPDAAPVVQQDVLQQIRDEGTVTRKVLDDATGNEVRLTWTTEGNKRKPHGNVAEALAAIETHKAATPDQKALAKYLQKVMAKEAQDVEVAVRAQDARSWFNPNGPGVSINRGDVNAAGATLADKISGLSRLGVEHILHETMHAATWHRLNAWERAAGKLTREQQKVLSQFEDLFERFREHVKERHPRTHPSSFKNKGGARYAASNMHEFAAQFFTDAETRVALDAMPGKALAGRTSSALREMMALIRRVLGFTNRASAFEEGSRIIDQLLSLPLDNVRYADGSPVFSAPSIPTGSSGKVNPLIARRSRDSWGERIYKAAEAYMARHPIDRERLNTLTLKAGVGSDGLVLANSGNAVLQQWASIVTETTTGAAGRRATVALRAHTLAQKMVGSALLDYGNAYTVWRNKAGGSAWEDMFRGDTRRKFDQKVYEEVLARRRGDYAPGPDRAVSEAADALEGLFERARKEQVDAAVLGADNLPTSSRGYIPQALDGTKLQAASTADMALLHDALAKQFQERLGFDERFARDFAPVYTERVRERAMGTKNIDGLAAGGEGLQTVRDVLENLELDPSLADRARAAASKLGQSHTRKRLDLDLTQELRPGLRMLDFYNTNPLLLARSYAKTTAGTVALTDAGIHGVRGVREVENAALWKGGNPATKEEMEAFRRTAAEILGTPVATARISAGASNVAMLVSLQRLGGLVFTQAAETWNMVHHLGLRSTLAGIASLPKMAGEVGRLKRGAPSQNHILTSLETVGGAEFGMGAYKMIAPLDAPDGRLAEYIDQPGVATRLLRAGGHAQAAISGFKGLMAAQHRMVAEQITKKALRYIRDGGDDVALADMGFTPDLVAAVKADLGTIAKWGDGDTLAELDLTRVSDVRIAEAFVQAVHRGTSQIIQGTYVGERGKWAHDDYMRVLLQLRTFGLTAMEKQWSRTRANHNFAYAAGVMLGQMALALPIYYARVQLMSAGREDREKYINDALKPGAVVRALMNYSSMSGLTADVLDLLMGLGGGWGNKEVRDALGDRGGMSNSSIVGRVIPAAGTVDKLWQVATGKGDLHMALKQLPFSNLPYLYPLINLTKD